MNARTPWKDLPQEYKDKLLGRKEGEDSWGGPLDNEYRREQIELLRNATIYTWTACRMICYICGKDCNGEPSRYTRLPFIAHIKCVEEAPVYKPRQRVATYSNGSTVVVDSKGKPMVNAKGEARIPRAKNVEQWVRNFHAQHDCSKEFTVHNVLEWIKNHGGPEFSYAGTRRICKILFTCQGWGGAFKAPAELAPKEPVRRAKKNKKVNTSMKQYSSTGRRKYGSKKKGKK